MAARIVICATVVVAASGCQDGLESYHGTECEARLTKFAFCNCRNQSADDCGNGRLPPQCMRSLTRTGLVDGDRYEMREVEYVHWSGNRYTLAFFHRRGGLHQRADGSYYAAMSLCGDDDRLDTSWNVDQSDLESYFDWFDRFKTGEGKLEELDELFP